MRPSAEKIREFKKAVWRHYHLTGRAELPWRHTRNPYFILVSEVMLQQTQVSRVLKYYPKFLHRFSTPHSLASAPRYEIMRLWQGMGYNRRAIMLQMAAQYIVRHLKGIIPSQKDDLVKLPGVGPATAGAVTAFAYNKPVILVETNIRRAVLHHFFSRKSKVLEEDIEKILKRTLNLRRPREWYWALMDYGASLPRISGSNDNIRSATYRVQRKFRGSRRQIRGEIVKQLAGGAPQAIYAKQLSTNVMNETEKFSQATFISILNSLRQDGIVQIDKEKNLVSLTQ